MLPRSTQTCPVLRREALRRRKGSSYIAVLGATLIVASMAYGGLLAVRSNTRVNSDFGDAAAARRCAEAALELGRLWIAQDPNWRSTRTSGTWASNQPLLGGTYTLEVIDTIDGDFANRPHDPVKVTATSAKGRARYKLELTLAADPKPLPALSCAVHAMGELHITTGKNLNASGATVSTNGTLQNDGSIQGNVEALNASPVGSVSGTVTLGAPAKAFPAAGVADRYAALGTLISPPSTIQLKVLGPGINPWGTPNSEGVYVIRPTTDLTIKDSRIYGTLVIFCSAGRKVIIDNNVFIHPYRADYPSLIIVGDAIFTYSSSLSLSEVLLLKNFNPGGASYQGSSDGDLLDTYPSEIQGLVHVTGRVDWKQTARIRGVLLGEWSGTEAIKIHDAAQAVYDTALYLNPPQWYTSQVFMRPQAGSWRRIAE